MMLACVNCKVYIQLDITSYEGLKKESLFRANHCFHMVVVCEKEELLNRKYVEV